MTAHEGEVEIPLLQQPEQPVAKTPLPRNQFWIILVLQFLDSLVFETLALFTPQLVKGAKPSLDRALLGISLVAMMQGTMERSIEPCFGSAVQGQDSTGGR
ncbi:hypothetical protein BDR04DRAFT_1123272 [Suillus decipiens]|nr:hypothetical protein BDR04DRAFT_1123272 [Suillus decipiens]